MQDITLSDKRVGGVRARIRWDAGGPQGGHSPLCGPMEGIMLEERAADISPTLAAHAARSFPPAARPFRRSNAR
jgi:hypothetical protein